MKLSKAKLTIATGLGAVVVTTALASAFPGEKLSAEATVTIVRARAIARHVVPGTILSEELEKEMGGTGLRYTFDIRGSGGVREIGIDAKTGRVLENTSDSAPTSLKSRRR